MRKILSFLTAVVLICTMSIGATACSDTEEINLDVSVAASLTDAITEINNLYMERNPNITITCNLASSGTLQKQIENGAPADVFISAASKQMDALEENDLILTATRRNLLNNSVVLIVPMNSELNLTSFEDLIRDDVKTIALGDPSYVPAGTYGQKALDQLGITAQIESKLVLGTDVRQVLSFVESGNADAGIVYSTDATISDSVKIVANAPDNINAMIVYPIAVTSANKNEAAANDYIDFLFSDEIMAIFEKYGFQEAQE